MRFYNGFFRLEKHNHLSRHLYIFQLLLCRPPRVVEKSLVKYGKNALIIFYLKEEISKINLFKNII